ncbi:hypothetical protein [Marinobacter sp. MBR-105]|jgi:hypothetical protein
MGKPKPKLESRFRGRKLAAACSLSLALVAAVSAPAGVQAAFLLEAPEPEEIATPSPLFDQAEYMVWVDHTYSAIVEYGSRGHIAEAPTYGDPMPLEDALTLLVPNNWVVLRSRDLTADGRLEVRWDIKRGDWIDVLRNLGERHGLRFHVDHAKREIFIQNGRKLLFDRPMHASGNAGQEVVLDDKQAGGKPNSSPVASKPMTAATFSVNQGDDGESVMRDLSLMLGYPQMYWLMPTLTVDERQTWRGEPIDVLKQAANSFNGRICLYQDQVVAIVSRSMECPR